MIGSCEGFAMDTRDHSAANDSHPPVEADAYVIAMLAETLETALWVYDFDRMRIVWANAAALALWDAADVSALAARDLKREMSASVQKRLEQHQEDFEIDTAREIREVWTLYPKGSPFRVLAILRRCDLGDGRCAMLVEAKAEDYREPTTIRSADALLHTPMVTALFDRDGHELYANPAFREAFGPGRHRFGADFIHAADAAHVRRAVSESGGSRTTAQVRTRQGVRWHDIHVAACRDSVTGDGAFLMSAFDVTEAQRQRAALAEALAAAEAADRAKARFLSIMSHEMRTPMNGVLGMASILGSTELTAPQRKALDVISESGGALLEMIEDMLDIVALDAGRIEIDAKAFDPALVLRSAIESVRAEAERKGLSMSIDSRHLMPGAYVGDASRIRQILRHLFVNAVKFTDEGAVTARVLSAGTDGRSIRFEVSDTGPGVPESERVRIFDRFHQVDGSYTRKCGGTGLGLAICRELIDLMGGSITLASTRSGGSTFAIELPNRAGSGFERCAPSGRIKASR
ncbi:MAG: PAS domain-containing protein [Rhodobacteraceae bacterium]|nr:MAG: PAS domain-containing protein [Paracoccaceae bacterium]